MREVDFRYLRSALESLNSSTDLVLARGQVLAILSRRCSPYVSRRGVEYEEIAPIAEGVLLAANYRRLLVVGADPDAVQETTERGPHPFDDALGWSGPRAGWVVECVPTTLLRPILQTARTYGLITKEWLESPFLCAAWLVPVVVDWDENGRPVFDWPDRPAEPEPDPDPVDPDLPVEI